MVLTEVSFVARLLGWKKVQRHARLVSMGWSW